LAEGLDMFRLGAIVSGENMNQSDNLSFRKINLAGWMCGSLTQRDGITLAEGVCVLGEIILDEGLHDWGRLSKP
jgi:hypothetical protein